MCTSLDRAARIAALLEALAPFAPAVPPPVLEAWAVAVADATPHGCAILADPGHGALTLEFARHWLAGIVPAPHHLPTPRPKRIEVTD